MESKANCVNPDLTAPLERSSLIWVYTVCPGPSLWVLRVSKAIDILFDLRVKFQCFKELQICIEQLLIFLY